MMMLRCQKRIENQAIFFRFIDTSKLLRSDAKFSFFNVTFRANFILNSKMVLLKGTTNYTNIEVSETYFINSKGFV
jgi:hypothetical protein